MQLASPKYITTLLVSALLLGSSAHAQGAAASASPVAGEAASAATKTPKPDPLLRCTVSGGDGLTNLVLVLAFAAIAKVEDPQEREKRAEGYRKLCKDMESRAGTPRRRPATSPPEPVIQNPPVPAKADPA